MPSCAPSGGFEANLDWLQRSTGARPADNFLIRGTPYNTGRACCSILLDQGAQPIGDPTQCHAVAIDARAPQFDGGIVTRLDCVPLGIVVNRDGERFYDEGEDFWPKRYAIWGRLVAQQPGQIAYSIIDAKAVRPLHAVGVPGRSRAGIDRGAGATLGLDAGRARCDGRRASTPRCAPGTFDHTRARRLPHRGPRAAKTHWARPIDTPPFYGYPLRPGITFTYLGVKVDERARVLMADGQPAANLFAAGEIMAGNILGKGYLAGFGMTIGTVFGRIAGEEAAAHARRTDAIG